MIRAEKLLVHGFPLHKMAIPCSIAQNQLGNMGGNTMHLMSIGFVLLLGLGLVRRGGQGVASAANERSGDQAFADEQVQVVLVNSTDPRKAGKPGKAGKTRRGLKRTLGNFAKAARSKRIRL